VPVKKNNIETLSSPRNYQVKQYDIEPPPNTKTTEWFEISYDKMENELVKELAQDIYRNKVNFGSVAILDIKLPGGFPESRKSILTNKIIQALSQYEIPIKECDDCALWQISDDRMGNIKLEKQYPSSEQLAKKTLDMGAETYLVAKLEYHPQQLLLHIKTVRAFDKSIVWNKIYSSDKKQNELNFYQRPHSNGIYSQDKLSSLLARQTSLHVALQLGVNVLPGIDEGQGGGMHAMPGVDIYFGERYYQSNRSFGLKMGGSFRLTDKSESDENEKTSREIGDPLPFAVTFGPKYVHHFNPLSHGIKYSLASEAGLFLSSGMITGYVSSGPEITVVKHYAISLSPIYVLESKVDSSETFNEQDDGSFESEGASKQGRAGGFGYALKLTMNW
jgi:hypothetical protein